LRQEVKEKSIKVEALEKENKILKASTSPEFASEMKKIANERDELKA